MTITEGHDIRADSGVVAAWPERAARVGAETLAQGGNAMDAACATALACCMLQPHMTDLGGYFGCAVVRDGKTGEVTSVDGNAVAPPGVSETMYAIAPPRADGNSINEQEYGCQVEDDANLFGPLAIATPGLMAAVGEIWERWGRRPWADIVAPSQTLIEDGFPYGSVAGVIAAMEATLRRFPASVAHLMPDGRLPSPEDIWHRPDMEKTLARLASAGWRDFYRGELGRGIGDAVSSAGGLVTHREMASFRARLTPPHTAVLGQTRVHCPILPNGALTVLHSLKMLEVVEAPVDDTPHSWHLLAEVLKLAWRYRLRELGDPDFVGVPVDLLLNGVDAAERAAPLRREPDAVSPPPDEFAGAHPHGTLHLSTADAEGNLVAFTITQGGAFGSCFTVPGTGIILGHGMCRFDPRPGRANSAAPGKRPLNNLGCLILETPDRIIATGMPGGRRIVSVMTRVAQLLAGGRSGREVALAPRLHVVEADPLEITRNMDATVVEALQAMGHQTRLVGGIGGAVNTAEWFTGVPESALRAGGNGWAAGVGRVG